MTLDPHGSYVLCDVVEPHETLEGGGDDGAAKDGGQVSPGAVSTDRTEQVGPFTCSQRGPLFK